MNEEVSFTLPKGYVAPDGRVHREGTLRLARAGDEIHLLEDPRVKGNRAYLVILLLARVITRLGDLEDEAVDAAVIEGLYSSDLAYLQRVFAEANGLSSEEGWTCPHCGKSVVHGEQSDTGV
jgi:hypothetical protein